MVQEQFYLTKDCFNDSREREKLDATAKTGIS